MMNLNNKNCVITGASSGIGLEITKHLLNQGGHVYSISLDIMPLKHKNLISYQCDLSDLKQVHESFNHAIEVFKSIDIYIANAGQARYGLSKDLKDKDLDFLIQLNFKAVVKSLNLMKAHHKDKPFTFVATSSVMAFWPLPGYACYSATKAALSTYIKAYRSELNKDQKLILIYPVATDTNFFKISGQKHKSWMIQSPQHVAKRTIKGIKKGKKHIYPSILFMFVYKCFPYLLKPYINHEIKKLKENNQ